MTERPEQTEPRRRTESGTPIQPVYGPGGRLRLKQLTELDLQLRRQGRQPLETRSSSGGTAYLG